MLCLLDSIAFYILFGGEKRLNIQELTNKQGMGGQIHIKQSGLWSPNILLNPNCVVSFFLLNLRSSVSDLVFDLCSVLDLS